MIRKILFLVLLIAYSTSGAAQIVQSALKDSANLIFRQIDDAIINGNKDRFCELQNNVLQIADEIKDLEFRFCIYNLSINKYFATGCYKEAIDLSIKSLEKAKKCFGSKHKEVASLLFHLGFSYAHDGQFQQAIEYGKQSVQMFEELGAINEETYWMSILLLTNYYNENGLFPQSISTLKNSLKKIDLNKIPPERLSIVYSSLAYSYSSLDNYKKAIDYKKRALELYEDKQSLNYWKHKQNLAELYSKNNDHYEAMQLIDEVCDTLKLRNKGYIYAMALCDKASIYIHSHNTDRVTDAIQYVEESAKIFENANDTLSNEYVHLLMIKAEAYRSINLYDEAEKIYEKVYSLQKQFLDTTDINNLETLSISAVLAGNLQDGLSCFKKLEQRIIQEQGEQNGNYIDTKYRITELYYRLNDYKSAKANIMDALPFIRNSLAKSFFQLEDKERVEFWNKYIYIFNESLPKICYTTSYFSDLMYDASLLSKGILLNTEKEKRSLMQGDATVDDFVKPFFLNWRDVQTKLKDDDIAIEFVKVNPSKEISAYLAVTIRRQYEKPKQTILFFEDELKQVPDTIYYQCKEMTDLVWKPLQAELEGVKNIYFSPSGALYNIGIEYLPGMENYNIHRLSSTRELVTRKDRKFKNRAVLYGGLDYYANLDTLNKSKSVTSLDETFVDHADVRGMGLRGGKEKLEHTKNEVEKIGEEFNRARWVCHIDSASLGTEESFKALSGRKVGCLHIATHGFYYTKKEADNTNYDFLHLNNYMTSAEDKALTRSGLILSGANHILEGDTLPDNVEDGILTAKEIADVDLRGLDLVVLSACQTGLGDISQGEGVFGLQRGFKKAGANSILMSLWEVDDKATQLLMTQFYRNLLAGQSKRQSLLSAQKYLREVEGGIYNEPKYWAAFILLDGIN